MAEYFPRFDQYRCTNCDYIYDELKGDAWSGIKPGTTFSELPENWVCPICMAEKDMFEEVSSEEFLKNFFQQLDKKRIKTPTF